MADAAAALLHGVSLRGGRSEAVHHDQRPRGKASRPSFLWPPVWPLSLITAQGDAARFAGSSLAQGNAGIMSLYSHSVSPKFLSPVQVQLKPGKLLILLPSHTPRLLPPHLDQNPKLFYSSSFQRCTILPASSHPTSGLLPHILLDPHVDLGRSPMLPQCM